MDRHTGGCSVFRNSAGSAAVIMLQYFAQAFLFLPVRFMSSLSLLWFCARARVLAKFVFSESGGAEGMPNSLLLCVREKKNKKKGKKTAGEKGRHLCIIPACG